MLGGPSTKSLFSSALMSSKIVEAILTEAAQTAPYDWWSNGASDDSWDDWLDGPDHADTEQDPTQED